MHFSFYCTALQALSFCFCFCLFFYPHHTPSCFPWLNSDCSNFNSCAHQFFQNCVCNFRITKPTLRDRSGRIVKLKWRGLAKEFDVLHCSSCLHHQLCKSLLSYLQNKEMRILTLSMKLSADQHNMPKDGIMDIKMVK